VIQIVLGSLAVLGALVILMGAGDTLRLPVGDLFPLIGFLGTGLIISFGALLIAQGIYSRRLRRPHRDRHGVRSGGLAFASLLGVLFLAFVTPLLAEPLNLIAIGGFPAGYYMAAQGSLLGLVILIFLTVLKQNTIDAEDSVDE
jgi:putative solute:sodium symporter small subunit